MTDYVGLVEYIVRNMVDHPDAVVVASQPGRGRAQTVEITLDPEDIGRVIGKGGRNIEAIRAVVKAASIKDHERVNVEVIADDLPSQAGDQADYPGTSAASGPHGEPESTETAAAIDGVGGVDHSVAPATAQVDGAEATSGEEHTPAEQPLSGQEVPERDPAE